MKCTWHVELQTGAINSSALLYARRVLDEVISNFPFNSTALALAGMISLKWLYMPARVSSGYSHAMQILFEMFSWVKMGMN